jgi:exodeoxyribonuclease III
MILILFLTEFVKNNHGQEIIDKLVDEGYNTQSSNDDKNLGSFIACKENFEVKMIDDRWTEVYIPKLDLNVLGVYIPVKGGSEKNYSGKEF